MTQVLFTETDKAELYLTERNKAGQKISYALDEEDKFISQVNYSSDVIDFLGWLKRCYEYSSNTVAVFRITKLKN